MSFLSGSSNRNHYRGGHYGSSHYQKKGLLGKLFNMVASGSSRSSGYHNNLANPYHNLPVQNPNIPNQPPVICHKCNSPIPSGSKFCLECGEKINEVQFCLSCGERAPLNAKFCSKCGNKLNG